MSMDCYQDKADWFDHPRNRRIAVVTTTYVENESVFKDVKLTMKCHDTFRQFTLPYDMILVDHSSPYPPFQSWLTSFNGKVLIRENRGFSFGGYNHAWEKFHNQYDFWLFHEQDIAPIKPHWLEEIFHRFLSDKRIGAVGNCIEYHDGSYWEMENKAKMINLCGAFTFTSREILSKCGILLDDRFIDNKEQYHQLGCKNELWFAQNILDRGYAVAGFNDGNRIFCNGSSCDRGNIPDNCDLITPMITIHGIKHKEIREHFERYKLI